MKLTSPGYFNKGQTDYAQTVEERLGVLTNQSTRQQTVGEGNPAFIYKNWGVMNHNIQIVKDRFVFNVRCMVHEERIKLYGDSFREVGDVFYGEGVII